MSAASPKLSPALEKFLVFEHPTRLGDLLPTFHFDYLSLEQCEQLAGNPDFAFSESFKSYLEKHPLFFTEKTLRGLCYASVFLWERLSDKNFTWLQVQIAKHFQKLSNDLRNEDILQFLRRMNEIYDQRGWMAHFTRSLESKETLIHSLENHFDLDDLAGTGFFAEYCSVILADACVRLSATPESHVILKDRSLRYRFLKELLPYARREVAIDFLAIVTHLIETSPLEAFASELCQHLRETASPGDPRLETYQDFWKQVPAKLLKTLRAYLRNDDLSFIVKENFGALSSKDREVLVHELHDSKNPRVLVQDYASLRHHGGILGSVFLMRNGHSFHGHLIESEAQEFVVMFKKKNFYYALSNRPEKALLVWNETTSPALKQKYWYKHLSWTDLLKTRPHKVRFPEGTLHQVFDLMPDMEGA